MLCLSHENGPCQEQAVFVVYWPGQQTYSCEKHEKKQQWVAQACGFVLSSARLEHVGDAVRVPPPPPETVL
jgi:hypothetical protein